MFSYLLLPFFFSYIVHKRINRPKFKIVIQKSNEIFVLTIKYNSQYKTVIKEIHDDVRSNVHQYDIIDNLKNKTVSIYIQDKSIHRLQKNSENIEYVLNV
jgi:hypothetical protein